ncbi:OmpA family protein [Pelotalea chapellei]|uniref:Outer membrane beta-barrel domain-containing protein n=1 Tax=Pelotalea chapellei TaxID=44671 RepID=A0ABS5U8L9_9BACT|nr:OmpA family protein [Pelotalea chapellei]MBT1071990.1 outer membrane beta-barrel domain-containing protein [Pelotalea chapellei]
MKKKLTLLLAGSLMAVATAATAANMPETFYLSPVVGGYTFEGKQHIKTAPVYGLKLGYNFTEHFGLEGAFDYAATETTRTNKDLSFYKYGADLIYNFRPATNLVPFIAAGYGGYNFSGAGLDKKARPAFDYGLGLKYFLNDNFAIRGDVRHVIASLNNEVHNRNAQNIEYTLGAYIPFGGTQPVAKAVAAPAVEPAPALKPVVVPPPAPAPPADSDRDGVIDEKDKCPNTPQGVVVDADGCPVDADKDGVADYLDKCPGTPAGASVDTNGCPLDSDKDGVFDYLDKCPDTPAGVKVTADGCPVPVAAPQKPAAEKYCSKPAVVDVRFATGKAAVDPKFQDDLKALADFLKEFPKAKGEISGHTDNVGGKAMNQKLSQQRADSVKKFIVDTYGVDANRITTKGYGFSKPIADNKTAAGKAKNRRIEANFTCE